MSAVSHAGSAPDREPIDALLYRWLVGLRWVVFGLLIAILPFGETWFGFHVRYALAAPVVAAVAIVSVVAAKRPLVVSRWLAFGVAFDLCAIGLLLAASGGAANPFSAVFFVYVALVASLLPARTTFALSALAACVFAALFLIPAGACCPSHPANGAFSTHLYGMWVAFVLCATLVAYFVTRVRNAMHEREREITRLRRDAESSARFAALGTLAAGTAHELATPLATIAVLAGELGQGAPEPAEASEHGAAITAQVARCRDVLTKMQAGAASPAAGRSPVRSTALSAVAAWRAAHPEAGVSVRVDVGDDVLVPLTDADLETALCALLDNALHASSAVAEVPISVHVVGGSTIELSVEDAGSGVAPDLEGRLGEPFLTTKEPGEGMGLGLYLVRRLLEGVGGRLEVARRQPHGTRVTLHLAPA